MNPLSRLDSFLNQVTMYRLLTYGLAAIACLGIGFSATGSLSVSTSGLVVSLVTYLAVCYATQKILSNIWQVQANKESWIITALILFFIMTPATTMARTIGAVGVGLAAIASKYLLAYHRKHLFNPAAYGAVVGSLTGILYAGWWVGNSLLLPFCLVLGLLVVRKIRRFGMVAIYALFAVTTYSIIQLRGGNPLGSALWQMLTSSPLVFLGTIMLTEPGTAPATKRWQYVFAAAVGGLSVAQLHIGDQLFTAEMALLAGNLLAFVVSPRYKLRLRLQSIQKISATTSEFVFMPDRQPSLIAGQYMDFTLTHPKTDARGNRRTFTVASSPTEKELRIGVKFYQPSSSFKKTLQDLQIGDTMTAGQQAGNFVLPTDPRAKLVFLAGGIGITPFRSMAKYLTDTNQKRDIVLFYMISDPSEFCYRDIFVAAEKIGLKTMPVLSSDNPPANWRFATGRLSGEIISRYAPDYADRTFYISGPPKMVDASDDTLRSMGIARRRIHTDHFSGY